MPPQKPIHLLLHCRRILNQPVQIVTPQLRVPQLQFPTGESSWVVRERQQGLGALHPKLFENLAPLHCRPLIVHSPQEQVLNDTRLTKPSLDFQPSGDALNDSLGLTRLILLHPAAEYVPLAV